MKRNNINRENFNAKFYEEVYTKFLREFSDTVDTSKGIAHLKYKPLGIEVILHLNEHNGGLSHAFYRATIKHIKMRVKTYANWLAAEYADEICALVRDGAFFKVDAKEWLTVELLDMANKPVIHFADFDIIASFESFLKFIRREDCK